jgi:hypothetical protein
MASVATGYATALTYLIAADADVHPGAADA